MSEARKEVRIPPASLYGNGQVRYHRPDQDIPPRQRRFHFNRAEDEEMTDLTIDPERAVPGAYVKYAFPSNGYFGDQTQAQRELHVGGVYVIERAKVEAWRTDLWLKGFKYPFNSVFFMEVEAPVQPLD